MPASPRTGRQPLVLVGIGVVAGGPWLYADVLRGGPHRTGDGAHRDQYRHASDGFDPVGAGRRVHCGRAEDIVACFEIMTTIAIVDYGMGNLRSVAQALRAAAPEADVAGGGSARGHPRGGPRGAAGAGRHARLHGRAGRIRAAGGRDGGGREQADAGRVRWRTDAVRL